MSSKKDKEINLPVSFRYTGDLNDDGTVNVDNLLSIDFVDTGDSEVYNMMKKWLDLHNNSVSESEIDIDNFFQKLKRHEREQKIDKLLDNESIQSDKNIKE